MNIFKILSSGDGSFREVYASAFIAYLFKPNAFAHLGDHGLGNSFVSEFTHLINPAFQFNDEDVIEVDVEPPMHADDGNNHYADIVIAFYNNGNPKV